MIIPLPEATPETAGAKAAALGRLIRAGFPVPPGFVIPTAAYHSATAHLDPPATAHLHQLKTDHLSRSATAHLNLPDIGDASRSDSGDLDRSDTVHLDPPDTGDLDQSDPGDVSPSDSGRPDRSDSGDVSRSDSGDRSRLDTVDLDLSDTGHLSQSDIGDVSRSDSGRPDRSDSGDVSRSDSGDVSRSDSGDLDRSVSGDLSGSQTGRRRRGVVVSGWVVDELAGVLEVLGGSAVAVRSSGGGEDGAEGSAAGQYDSYLGVEGLDAVVAKVQLVWGSLWSRRAIAYRLLHPERTPEIAVIVQRHVDAEVAGVLFTADPRKPGGAAVVEASWGLGESVVQGLVTPDSYVVQADGEIDRRLGSKAVRRDRRSGGDGGDVVSSEVPVEQREELCLGDEQVRRIVRLGREVAELMGGPQDIEFAMENDRVWLLQARPITAPLDATHQPRLDTTQQPQLDTTHRPQLDATHRPRLDATDQRPTDEEPVLRGVAGSAGTASGPARLVRGVEDFGRVEAGDILVCRFTDPAWTPLFGVVAGVVTEVGGRLSHAAIVAREHRIPAVLGVPGAMSAVEDGQVITIVGDSGIVSAPGLVQS